MEWKLAKQSVYEYASEFIFVGERDFWYSDSFMYQGREFIFGTTDRDKKPRYLIDRASGLNAVTEWDFQGDRRTKTFELYREKFFEKLEKSGTDIDELIGKYLELFKLWKIMCGSGLL